MTTCQISFVEASEQAQNQDTPAAAQRQSGGLLIENDSELPVTYPYGRYELRFRARGGISELHWKLEKGALPPGIKLEDNGLLHGQAQRSGEFQFTVSVTDNVARAPVQKGFVLRVISALTVVWKSPARVSGNRIDGTVDVSNTTPDDMDLTFYVLAVADNGRATAIGYQHFLLAHGTIEKELPFGDTLPNGAYVVHVDAVGEVAAKKLIYREHLQTPKLQVTVGP